MSGLKVAVENINGDVGELRLILFWKRGLIRFEGMAFRAKRLSGGAMTSIS